MTTFEERLAAEKPVVLCTVCAALADLTPSQRDAYAKAAPTLSNAARARVLQVGEKSMRKHDAAAHSAV